MAGAGYPLQTSTTAPDVTLFTINLAIAQINIDTLGSLMGRAVIALPSPEKENCIVLSKFLPLLQSKLIENQAALKKISGKSDQEWDAEEQVVKKDVANLQKTSPELFIAHQISSDTPSFEQLKKCFKELTEAIQSYSS